MKQSEEQKSIPDQVVLIVDPRNSISKPTPEKSPDPTSKEKPRNPTTTTRTRTLRRLVSHSKRKARFVELNDPHPLKPVPDSEVHQPESESESDDEFIKEEERYAAENDGSKKRKINVRAMAEWVIFIVIMACLVSSLFVPYPSHWNLQGLELWKWCLTVLVICCGRLVSSWLVRFIVFLIERNFILREKVLYFVYGLRGGVQICVWLSLVLLAWTLLFDRDDRVSRRYHRLLNKVEHALIAILAGSIIWLVKIVLVKMVASSFHVSAFFDRMKESIFHQYILETLSGEPIGELSQSLSQRRMMRQSKTLPARFSLRSDGFDSKRMEIDMEQLRRLSRGNASTWGVKRLISHVMSTGLSTISKTVDETMEEFREKGEISNEGEAKKESQRIFKHVAKAGAKYIEEDDLLKFLNSNEVRSIFPLFQGSETGKIRKSAFRGWVVKAYKEWKALAHALNDTKTAVEQLHKLASAVVIVIIIVVSLLVMGVATSKVILIVTSQLLLVGFMFGNTCKTIFESIIFVFVVHPFDVGDRCVIDGVQMVVDEMNILTTIFLRFDNEKIYYPNAVLLTKAISNFNRSPEMGDTVEFSMDVMTLESAFNDMKTAIRAYIDSKPKHWQPKHSVVVNEIEEVNKMKIGLNVLHTINFQNFSKRNKRRSELIFELKRIFERLSIKYHLLPQQIHLTQFTMPTAKIPVP
ncbi:mechanosensitive ion channel protein 10-like [Magnolia sinica]|uniref:mechanosensitive ion channel protein 10-like n=1 Tax=Magnolia sinica TaxID=86752 RepID=UPI002659F882|nr:mechanosensitive ion channel protein 10-like [Magnolia sinica]